MPESRIDEKLVMSYLGNDEIQFAYSDSVTEALITVPRHALEKFMEMIR